MMSNEPSTTKDSPKGIEMLDAASSEVNALSILWLIQQQPDFFIMSNWLVIPHSLDQFLHT
eukprot:6596439-Ditylum_brightwellii.AAC.1